HHGGGERRVRRGGLVSIGGPRLSGSDKRCAVDVRESQGAGEPLNRVAAGPTAVAALQILEAAHAQACPFGQRLLGETGGTAQRLEQRAEGRGVLSGHCSSAAVTVEPAGSAQAVTVP